MNERTWIDLLWTGGWDSTFRLLYLVLVEERAVKPYYVVDTGRRSALFELKAHEQIKADLCKTHPEAKNRLAPSTIFLGTDIGPDDGITSSYQALLAKAHAGIQYEWLARLAVQLGLQELEICLEKYPPSHDTKLRSLMLPALVGEGHDCRIREDARDVYLDVFRYFRFPTIHLTKADMGALAKRCGFYDMMQKTWFCHDPTSKGLACGECRPCEIRRESGVPADFARRGYAKRFYWKLSSLLGRQNG